MTAAPKVSVLMITYNHAPFIAEAIESVLMQQTNFDFELVIGEDCSPDNTRELIAQYVAQYPAIVRLLPATKNLGAHRNFEQVYKAAKGDYFAHLEGDDYWTAPDKLQVFADHLDANPKHSTVFGDVELIDTDGTLIRDHYFPHDIAPVTTIEELFVADYIPNMAVMYRRNLFGDFPSFITEAKVPMVDWPLHLMNADTGDLAFIDRVFARYRQHDGGIWSGVDLRKKVSAHLNLYQLLNAHFNYRFDRLIKKQIAFNYYWLATEQMKFGERRAAIGNHLRALKTSPFNMPISYGLWARLLARWSFPQLYQRLGGAGDLQPNS